MKLLSIEPTPSPNSMKLNVDQKLPNGIQKVYDKNNLADAPELMKKLLQIDGVTSLFHTADFIAIDRKSTADWQQILSRVREIFGDTSAAVQSSSTVETSFGEAQVFVQMFRQIPMQVKVTMGTEQIRAGLPERFMKAAMTAGAASPNVILERKWIEHGVRYGDLQEIGQEVAQEIDATYDQERLDQLVEQAMQMTGEAPPVVEEQKEEKPPVTLDMFDQPEWQKRYAVLEQMEPTEEQLPVLVKALHDPKSSIRRLATVYLGMVGGDKVLPYLFEALEDESVSVRRTAGDTLSDLGDPRAIGPMARALKDRNKLVRWRAARFLYEVGDESALPALREAEDDPEFEVRLQVKMALKRIESGEAASGTVWQQMTRRND
ncbi:virulence factor [Brevibacillus fulvus]|uniref:Scaffold protein Nfu/NifU N-terminal domain-containing protein n=1 Tax=Brevibacillus fulvus TaxID=1125967 RepID=A0A938XYE2_9BACL|nr:virulence factor [Brevibacillus fulvus]MBM7589918.1 hypothetical protein [Brevibacillus fulvus]